MDQPRERFVFRSREDTLISFRQVHTTNCANPKTIAKVVNKKNKHDIQDANKDFSIEAEWDFILEELKEMVIYKHFKFQFV